MIEKNVAADIELYDGGLRLRHGSTENLIPIVRALAPLMTRIWVDMDDGEEESDFDFKLLVKALNDCGSEITRVECSTRSAAHLRELLQLKLPKWDSYGGCISASAPNSDNLAATYCELRKAFPTVDFQVDITE